MREASFKKLLRVQRVQQDRDNTAAFYNVGLVREAGGKSENPVGDAACWLQEEVV